MTENHFLNELLLNAKVKSNYRNMRSFEDGESITFIKRHEGTREFVKHWEEISADVKVLQDKIRKKGDKRADKVFICHLVPDSEYARAEVDLYDLKSYPHENLLVSYNIDIVKKVVDGGKKGSVESVLSKFKV